MVKEPGVDEDPPFRRIAADLRAAIERGDYQPGHQLPSGSALMKQYGVARQTVQNVFDALRAEGLVTTRPGAGVFVRAKPAVTRLTRNRLSRQARQGGKGAFLGDAAASGFTPSAAVTVRTEPASERVADALGLAPGEEVLVRERVLSADGDPVQLATSRLPRTITAGTRIETEDTGPGGSYARLEEAGYVLHHFTEHVSTRPASSAEAETLRLAPGSPVLCVCRIAFDTAGAPLEINDMILAGDRYELVYEIPAE